MRGKILKRAGGQTWVELLRQAKPDAASIRETALQLHEAKQYEELVRLIEAALICGRSEPWMYDVLGVAMQLAGRPAKDVERALLSRIDFTASDVPSMLYSAAYLKRFGADAQALKLYRQASRLAPLRPEPYILSLPLAQQAKDWDLVGWAAAGIISYAWTPGHETLHKRARGAAEDAAKALLQDGQRTAAEKLRKRIRDAQQRDLLVTLRWSGQGDLDLLVEEPGGTVCSFKNPQTDGGGFHLHDGRGPKQENCYEEYVCPVARSGDYKIRVRHIAGDVVGKRARLEIVRFQGSPRESRSELTVQVQADDTVITVPLPGGRADRKPPR